MFTLKCEAYNASDDETEIVIIKTSYINTKKGGDKTMVARANDLDPLNANNYSIFDSVVQVLNPNSYGSGAHLHGAGHQTTANHSGWFLGWT